MEDDVQPSTSRGHQEADDDSDDEYMEIFDPDKFIRDGNDIRFQLPSNNAALTLSRNMDDVMKRSATIKRRNTNRKAVMRKKSSKPPTIVDDHQQHKTEEDRSSKPKIVVRQSSLDYDVTDGRAAENERLMSSEDQFKELQNIRTGPSTGSSGYPMRTYTSFSHPLSSLTLPMGQKRDYREHIKKRAHTQPSGLTLARHTATKKWLKIRKNVNEISHYADIWRGTLKEIEGQFGAGIMEYFKLVKWMIFLNLLLCIPMLFIIVPQLILSPSTFDQRFAHPPAPTLSTPAGLVQTTSSYNVSTQPSTTRGSLPESAAERIRQLNSLKHDEGLARECTAKYNNKLNATQQQWYLFILDFVQGTGWFEYTPLFYGYYFNKTSGIGGEVVYPWYNTSVAYLVATMLFFLISLVFIVVSTSAGLEDNVLADQMVYYKSINQVFAGWDFGLYKEKSAKVKKSLIRLEIMRDLVEKKRSEKYHNRSSKRKCMLYLIRLAVNIIVIGVLVGCAVAIYYTQQEADRRLASKSQVEKEQQSGMDAFTDLVWQYLPSVLITVMYAIFPIPFKKLATFERYYPATEQNITIARIVFLRLGTVFLLLLPIYINVFTCANSDKKLDSCEYCDYQCWETFIGQQLYKLVLLDFFVIVGVVFFVEFPRKALWKKYHRRSTLIRYIGEEEFDIPVNVMDMVYTQTLCWVGSFYCPLLPFITLFKVIIFFLVRKLSLFHNQKPASAPYRASSMSLFFKCVLTLAFFIAVLAVGVSIGVVSPSRSCGPFRTHSSINKIRGGGTNTHSYTMFGSIAEALLLLPDFLRDLINLIASGPFLAALIVSLLLLIYVYAARANGQVRLVELLRDTLKREEKDKHWLLQKVNNTLRKQLSLKPRSRHPF